MDDLDLALHVAAAGADVVRHHFGTVRDEDLKAKFNPVTEADRQAEATIVELLTRHRPSDGVLAEEGSGSAQSGRRWIVDPLDGTVNFVHGIPHIAVSVGLYEGNEPLVGVIHDVVRGEVFVAMAGEGAELDGTAIRVSGAGDPKNSVIATGFPYDHDRYAERYSRVVGAVLEHVNGIRRMGAAALDLAWVAAGRYEGYWELGIAPWDVAAGLLLVREAGGRVTDIDGTESVPDTARIVASNGSLHEFLCSTIATANREPG